MHYTLANLALVASTLLVKDVLAAPQHAHMNAHKRDVYVVVDNIMVTEEVAVTQMADGSFATADGVAVGTTTIAGIPSLMPTAVVPTFTSVAVVESTSSSAVDELAVTSAAVFIESPKSSTTAEPTTTEAPVVVVPTTTAQPTTFATVTSSSAPAASSVTSISSKRGAAYNDASFLTSFEDTKISWAYNWGSATASIPSNFNYAPMLWGLSSDNTKGWSAAATKAIAAGSTHLLAFNEPDYSGQANLSPADAATGYKTYMMPFASQAKLVSPAVTNGGDPMGLAWMKSFISACSSCQIDAVAIHWYNGGDAAAFKTYVADAYAAGGNRPLWITEFQAPGTSDEQVAFLEEVIPFLDDSDMVERYAYFGVFADNLVTSAGTALSALGQAFATLA